LRAEQLCILRSELEGSKDAKREKVGEENDAGSERSTPSSLAPHKPPLPFSYERKVNKVESTAFEGKCSAVVHNKLLAKLKDHGGFSIPCLIGNVSINMALCNLGSSVNLIPLFIFKRLDLQ